jgi:DNA polymerase-3 subunit alpha
MRLYQSGGDQMPALALTDLANLFGLVKFYQSTRHQHGVKPVLGCDVWITNETDRNKPLRLLLLCQSRRLFAIVAAACRVLIARINIMAGLKSRKHGCIRMNMARRDSLHYPAHVIGDIGHAILQNNTQQATEQQLTQWADLFPDRFYLELQRDGHAKKPCWCSNR